jgi:FKBP12-rapamycin complex-associated protein
MRGAAVGLLDFHLLQLIDLIVIVKHHIKDYLPEIITILKEHWNENTVLQNTILHLVEAMAVVLDEEFKVQLPILLPYLIQNFKTDSKEKIPIANKVLEVVVAIGSSIEGYLHILLPSVISLFDTLDVPVNSRKQAIHTIGQMAKSVDFTSHASCIIQPLIRVLNHSNSELRAKAISTITTIAYQLGPDYAIFVPIVNKVCMINCVDNMECYLTIMLKRL